jgi:hypothetical protein
MNTLIDHLIAGGVQLSVDTTLADVLRIALTRTIPLTLHI